VLTSSMTPSYPAGTLVIVKPTDPQQIRIGDVITYQIKSGQPEVVTHRVIQIVEPAKVGDTVKFITKGDANSLADPVVKPIQVRGTVWYAVPYIGWINNIINGSTRNALVPIIAGGLFLYAGYMAASTFIDRRRKAAAAAKAGQDEIDEELSQLIDAGRD
jgi:signal peptidase